LGAILHRRISLSSSLLVFASAIASFMSWPLSFFAIFSDISVNMVPSVLEVLLTVLSVFTTALVSFESEFKMALISS